MDVDNDNPGNTKRLREYRLDEVTMEEVVREIAELSQLSEKATGNPNVFPLDETTWEMFQIFVRTLEKGGLTPVVFHRLCSATPRLHYLCSESRFWDALFLVKFVIKEHTPLHTIVFADYKGNRAFEVSVLSLCACACSFPLQYPVKEWLAASHLMPDHFARFLAWITAYQMSVDAVGQHFIKQSAAAGVGKGHVNDAPGFAVGFDDYDGSGRVTAIKILSETEFHRREEAREKELTRIWLRRNPAQADDDLDERRQEMEDYVDGALREEFYTESGDFELVKHCRTPRDLMREHQEFLDMHGYMLSAKDGSVVPRNPRVGLYVNFLVYQLLESGFVPRPVMQMATDPLAFAQCLVCSSVSESRCKTCKGPLCGKQCNTQHIAGGICMTGKGYVY